MTASSGKPRSMSTGGVVALVLLGILFVTVVYSCATSASSSDDSEDGSGMAEVMCEEFVTDRLKSPSSAEFAGADSVTPLGDDQYEVTASVDSQNGFGAMIRTEYVCTIQDSGDDTWNLVSLDLDE